MTNELKLNTIEHIEKIEELVEVCRENIREETRGINAEATKVITQNYRLDLRKQVLPIVDELKDILNQGVDNSDSKLDLIVNQEGVQRIESLHFSILNDNFGQVDIKLKDFKSYLEGLGGKDEQLHRPTTKQGSTSKQGKESSNKKN